MAAGGTLHETDSPPDFGMTELEEALRGPDGNQVRHSALARIDGLMQKIEACLSIGVDPRQIESISVLQKSLVAARNIVISAPR